MDAAGFEPPFFTIRLWSVPQGLLTRIHFLFLVGRGGLEPPLLDFQSSALTIFATDPIYTLLQRYEKYFKYPNLLTLFT